MVVVVERDRGILIDIDTEGIRESLGAIGLRECSGQRDYESSVLITGQSA